MIRASRLFEYVPMIMGRSAVCWVWNISVGLMVEKVMRWQDNWLLYKDKVQSANRICWVDQSCMLNKLKHNDHNCHAADLDDGPWWGVIQGHVRRVASPGVADAVVAVRATIQSHFLCHVIGICRLDRNIPIVSLFHCLRSEADMNRMGPLLVVSC